MRNEARFVSLRATNDDWRVYERKRGRDERSVGWQDETSEEQDPTQWGALEAVCSAAWLTRSSRAAARTPSRVWRNRAHCEQTSTPVHEPKMTCRNTQEDIHTRQHTVRNKVKYSVDVMREIPPDQRQVRDIFIGLQQEREAKEINNWLK